MEAQRRGYAEGGEVSPWSFKGIANTVRGAFKKTPEQLQREADTAAYMKKSAQAEAKAPATAKAPEQTTAITAYAGNAPLGKRMDAEGLAAGGAIRGKGTGTSDEIPAMLSNGEYVIKAASAKIAGKPLLEAINSLADTKGKAGKCDCSKKGALREMATGVPHLFGGGSAADEKARVDALAEQQKAAFAQQQANSNEIIAARKRAVDAREAVLNITSPSVPKPSVTPAISQAYPDESQRAPAVNAAAPAPVAAAPTPAAPAGALPGITRIDQGAGKSPLFTNLAADDPSNVALMKRGPVTAENQAAMDGIQARQDASDARKLQAAADGQANSQAARDSSDLQQLAARAVLEKQGVGRKERAAISNRTAEMERTLLGNQVARRGQDITSRGQDQQAGALRESQKLAQNRFGLDQNADSRAGATFADQQQAKARLNSALDAYGKAAPEDRAALAEQIRVLQGKDKAAPPDAWGIRKVTAADGSVTEVPYNKHTGEDRGSQQAKTTTKAEYDKLPKGATYTAPDGSPRIKG